MKTLHNAAFLVLALVLAVSLSACQKKSETEMSAVPNDSQAAVEPAPDATTPPAEEPAPAATEPAPVKATKTTTKHVTKSTHSSTTVPASETRTVSLPSGSTFAIELVTPINTGQNNVGDPVEGKLMQPLTADGMVIAEQGSMIRGEITELKRASRSKGEDDRASAKFQFTSLQTVDGEKTLSATVTNVEGTATAGGTGKRDALIIGGSTVAGAVLGKVIGKDTKGAVIGAVGGAVVGTGIVMASKGHELDLPAGSKVTLRADQPITVVAR
jgi:hypothetical protein